MTTRLSDGDPAPPFTLPDADGKNVSLADFPGQRVIVYFYPAAMTPGCTTQAVDFTGSMDEFDAAGVHVIGISPDAQEKLIQFREQESVAFPLLSDVDKSTLNAYGAYGEKLLYGKLVEGVIRSTFVIDVDDKGPARWRSPSTTSRRPVTSTSSSGNWRCRARASPQRLDPIAGPAGVVELVDTQDLGSCAFGCEGSSPSFGTVSWRRSASRGSRSSPPTSSSFANEKACSLTPPQFGGARSRILCAPDQTLEIRAVCAHNGLQTRSEGRTCENARARTRMSVAGVVGERITRAHGLLATPSSTLLRLAPVMARSGTGDGGADDRGDDEQPDLGEGTAAGEPGHTQRAGRVTEVFVTGMLARWMRVRPRPMAIGANPFGARSSVAPRMM